MATRSAKLQHPEAPLLMQYLTQGCEVSCGRIWTKTEMATAVNRKPHPTERTPGAISAFKKQAKKSENN